MSRPRQRTPRRSLVPVAAALLERISSMRRGGSRPSLAEGVGTQARRGAAGPKMVQQHGSANGQARRWGVLLGCALAIAACGDSESAPASPEGVWLFDAPSSDAVFASNVDCSGEPVVEAALSVEEGHATFSVETDDCSLGPHEGEIAEGDDGFLANMTNRYDETMSITCIGDGPSAYVCEHSWLEGEFRVTRL